jgi:ribosomal protein S15P/S13E
MNLEEEIIILLKEVNGNIRAELEIVKKSKNIHETRLILLEANLTTLREKLQAHIKDSKERRRDLENLIKNKKNFWNENTIKLFIYIAVIILAILGINFKL